MTQPQLPDLPGVEHRYVETGDVRLHVAQAGEGPPLLLLHGWPQHWWCWRHLIPELAREYRVLAVDLRGWGWSDAPPGEYRKPTYASDVLSLMDAEGIQRARVIGHDWGGFTAFLMALMAPERIERMVTLDIPPPWNLTVRPRQILAPLLLSYQLVVAAPVLGPATMARSNAFVRTIIAGGSHQRWRSEDLDVYANVLREPARARASTACYRTFLTRELPEALRRRRPPQQLEVPTLLLMGARSPLQRALNPRSGPNLTVEEIPDAGHFLPEEAPAEVLDRARPFLAAG